jgi:hypothetical protein
MKSGTNQKSGLAKPSGFAGWKENAEIEAKLTPKEEVFLSQVGK